MSPDVAVVVVTYNSEHVIDDFIDSLPAAAGNLNYELVVVDNGSTDTTLDVLNARPEKFTIVKAPNRGYAAGINRGAAALPGSTAILAANPDVRMGKLSIQWMFRALKTYTNVGIVAPKVLNDDQSLFYSLRREPTFPRALGLGFSKLPALSEAVQSISEYSLPHRVDWALGAALLVSTDLHAHLGGWDETFFMYSEETDLCFRAMDLGMETWYEPAAVVTHVGGQSGQSSKLHSMQILNRVRLYSRRHGKFKSWAYFVASALSQVSWILRGKTEAREALIDLARPGRRPIEIRDRHFIPR